MGKGAKKRRDKNLRKRHEEAVGGVSDGGYGPSGRKRKGKGRRGYKGDKNYTSFKEQLHRKGFRLQVCAADGNCFFRAVGQQLDIDYETLRKLTCDYIAANADVFRPFVEDEDETFEEYVKSMREDGEWAGQPEMMAVSWSQQVSIWVHQVHPEPTYLIDAGDPNAKVIHVSYHDGIHFNAVYPNAEADEKVAQILAAGPPPSTDDSAAAARSQQPTSGKAKAAEAAPSEDERFVMRSTGCEDLAEARFALSESGGDPNAAVEAIVARIATAADVREAAADADAAAGLEDALLTAALAESLGSDHDDALLVAALDESVGNLSLDTAPNLEKVAENTEAEGGGEAGEEGEPSEVPDAPKGKSKHPKGPSKRDKKKEKKLRKQQERKEAAAAAAAAAADGACGRNPPPPITSDNAEGGAAQVELELDLATAVIRM